MKHTSVQCVGGQSTLGHCVKDAPASIARRRHRASGGSTWSIALAFVAKIEQDLRRGKGVRGAHEQQQAVSVSTAHTLPRQQRWAGLATRIAQSLSNIKQCPWEYCQCGAAVILVVQLHFYSSKHKPPHAVNARKEWVASSCSE